MRTGHVNLQAVRARVDRLAEQCRENHRTAMRLKDLVAASWRDDSASDPPSDEHEEPPPGSLAALICGTPRNGTTHAG